MLKNVNCFCQFLITLRKNIFLTGTSCYKLLHNAGCMKECQGNTNIIKILIQLIGAKGFTYEFRSAKCARKSRVIDADH